MSIAKARGKSALGHISTTGNQRISSNNNSSQQSVIKKPENIGKSYAPPTTSLLKIEPFVPTLSQRFRKPFYRSYSTLSTAYLKRTSVESNSRHHHRNSRHVERNLQLLTRQRSRSSLSSSVCSSQNGICRVNRQTKEQEKLPDRINYDRRGLTAIPFFENEKNLRLLSLQHNLINVFQIPDSTASKEAADNLCVRQDDILEEDENATDIVDHTSGMKQMCTNATPNTSDSDKAATVGTHTISKQTQQRNLGNLKRNLVINPTPTLTDSVNHAANGPVGSGNPMKSTASTIMFESVGGNLGKTTTSFVQKSVILHAQQRYSTLKKSKSFISNYSKHFAINGAGGYHHNITTTTTNSSHTSPFKQKLSKSSLLKPNNLSSFNGDCTNPSEAAGLSNGHVGGGGDGAANGVATVFESCDNDKEPICADTIKALKVKNNQLTPDYGQIFQNLVFLDLYDNQIEKISNLDGLKCLTVLLLGKNRITDISGLSSLKKTLRVLDLHGNRISTLSNRINCLQELKSLNLAGNQVRQINGNDFAGLLNLKELNLKRNKIKKILGFNHLNSLERLWLCHNDLQKVEDMSSIAKAIKLQEVSIENNPVSLAGDCVSFLVSYLPCLMMLSQMPITEQVRRAAMAWRKNKESCDSSYSSLTSDVSSSIRREEVISNARTNWELLRSQQMIVSSSSLATPSHRNGFVAAASGGSMSCQNALQHASRVDQNASSKSNNKLKAQEIENFATATTPGKSVKVANPAAVLVSIATNTGTTQTVPANASSLGINLAKNSNDNEKCINKNESELQDLFRLPPILKTFVASASGHGGGVETSLNNSNNSNPSSGKTHSSGSSLGPNIDSSSSCFSSDTEQDKESKHRSSDIVISSVELPVLRTESIAIRVPHVIEQPALECEDVHLHPVQQEHYKEVRVFEETSGIIIPDNTSSLEAIKQKPLKDINPFDSDKNSNISISTLRSVEPENTITAAVIEKPAAKVSNKGLPPTRRYMQGSLIRAQTAKPRTSVYSNNSSSISTNAVSKTLQKPMPEREREQGGDYLIEICGRYLNVYGLGALRFIDKQWNPQKASDVHTLNFSYINFNSIVSILSRIKFRFPNVESFVFRETNITSLGQLNALAELQGITSLVIDPEGNSLYMKTGWRLYAIYRLQHWGLKSINGVEIVETEIEMAQAEYSSLSDLVLWSLPESLVQPLLTRLRLDENCAASKLSAKQWLMNADPSLKAVVGKEALQWKRTAGHDDGTAARERGKMHFTMMIENTCNAVEKLQKLETLWPSLLYDIIRNSLLDYSHLENYLNNLLEQLLK